jgi:hypothetical protein
MSRPTGFAAKCRCGSYIGALDAERTDRSEMAKLLGEWLFKGMTVEPRFTGTWSVDLQSCRCSEKETSALCPHGMPLAENVCGPCSEGEPNTWRCTICNLLNPADAAHCRQCEYSRTIMCDGKRVPRDGQR